MSTRIVLCPPPFEFRVTLRGADTFEVPVVCHAEGWRWWYHGDLHRLRFARRRDGMWLVSCPDHPGEPTADLVSMAFTAPLSAEACHCYTTAARLLAYVDLAEQRHPKLQAWVVAETAAVAAASREVARGATTILSRAKSYQRSGYRPWAWYVVDPWGDMAPGFADQGLSPDGVAGWLRTTGPYETLWKPGRLAPALLMWSQLGVQSPEEAIPWVEAGINGAMLYSATSDDPNLTLETIPEELRTLRNSERATARARLTAAGVTDEMIAATGLSVDVYSEWHLSAQGDHRRVSAFAHKGGAVLTETGFLSLAKNTDSLDHDEVPFPMAVVSLDRSPDPRLAKFVRHQQA